MGNWCDVTKRRASIYNTFKWLKSGHLDPFGEKKNWLQTDMKRFGRNNALDFFAKDIPKNNKFWKRWSHINSQTACVKQNKHVDFIPRNVVDHHQLIVEGGTGFFCNGKVMPQNDDENWKMIFNHENSLGFSTELKIGKSVFKNDSGTFERSALWVFYC